MWYAADLLFKSVHTPPIGGEPVWEESFRLIRADTDEEARDKAESIGRLERVHYEAEGSHVEWVFERVERVHRIEGDALVDGIELFHRFLRESEVVSLHTPFDDE